MTTNPDDGGPAFPVAPDAALTPATDWGGNDISSGMSLRDYIAIKALGGICAHPDTWGLLRLEIVAKSYQIADDMLAARKGGAA